MLPSDVLSPTSRVITSPTLYSTPPLVLRCFGITISSSFSGNLPSINFIPKFEKQTQIWIQQCISKSQHWEENLQQKQMASFLSQAVVHAALDGIKENNFEKLSQSFLSLDQIFYALHVKDNIVSFYDKEHS